MFYFILLLFFFINNLSKFNCDENLCQIQINVNDQVLSINELNENYFSKINEVHMDTYYHVFCVTNEKTRSRNMLRLGWQENSKNTKINTIYDFDEYHYIELSNETLRTNDLSYLKGGFVINSNDLKTNYNLFCRFLTVNPKIYCEKEVKLIVLPFSSLRFQILIFVLLLLLAVGGVHLFMKLYSKRKLNKNNKNESNKLKKHYKCPFNSIKKPENSSKIIEKEDNSTSSNQQFQIAIPITSSEPYESIQIMSSGSFNQVLDNKNERLVI